jgi:general secretion pathway protein D
MGFGWARIALSSVLIGIASASAFGQQGADVRLDLSLKDADMMQATNMLFVRAGISFVVEPSKDPYRKITLKLNDVTAEEAVRYICQSAGAYFRRDENGIYVISHTRPEPTEPTEKNSAKLPKTLKRIKLQHTDSRDIYGVLVRNIPFNTGRGFDDIKRSFPQIQGEFERQYGKGATPQNTVTQDQSFAPVSRKSNVVPENSSDVVLPGEESSNQIGGFGGGAAGGGFGGGNAGGGLQGGGRGTGGGAGGGGLLVGGQGLVPDSIDFITFDPTDNSLLVRGNEDDINQLQAYINLFDVAPKQVQIKVEFITTTEGLTKSFGSEFLYNRGSIITGTTPGQFVRSSDPVFLSYSTGNVTARLRTSLSTSNAKTVSAPIVRTLNNQPASVFSTITTYAFHTTQTVSNGAVVSSTNSEPVIASTNLTVAPRINEDGTITMYLTPQVTANIGTSVGPNGNSIQNQSSQGVQLVAIVHNNETIVLGGLTTTSNDAQIQKVPVLADLPVIGQFFRLTTTNKSTSELLIFVTPTVIENDFNSSFGGPY